MIYSKRVLLFDTNKQVEECLLFLTKNTIDFFKSLCFLLQSMFKVEAGKEESDCLLSILSDT